VEIVSSLRLTSTCDTFLWLAREFTGYVCADARQLGVRDESIDLIVALGLFWGVTSDQSGKHDSWLTVLHECRRVLRRNQSMFVSNSAVRESVAVFRALCNDAGFQEDRLVEDAVGATDPRYLMVLR